MIRILGTIFAGLLGLAFGSFLNVCLSRWPEGESIVKPALPLPPVQPHARLVGEHPARQLARPARPLPHLPRLDRLALSAGGVGGGGALGNFRVASLCSSFRFPTLQISWGLSLRTLASFL